MARRSPSASSSATSFTLDQLTEFGAISPEGAAILKIIGKVRCNVRDLGAVPVSGKTTLLNCLTNYIEPDERIITCEDTAELQLQQVARRASRDPSAPTSRASARVTMRDLVAQLPAHAARPHCRWRSARARGFSTCCRQ